MPRNVGVVVVVVLDSVGIGALPDAAAYGDEGANTLAHVARAVGGLSLPTLAEMGLHAVSPETRLEPVPTSTPGVAYGRMMTASWGKDTTTGHWELMGQQLAVPLLTFPDGFPAPLVARIEQRLGTRTLGGKPASGTEIIDRLGCQHLATGRPIIYTSADSVLQVAAHEDVIPPDQLHGMCQRLRELLDEEGLAVGRVIARPFAGQPGSFARTVRRRDFSLAPPFPTVLDLVARAGLLATGVGKIADVFVGRGLGATIKTGSNDDGIRALIETIPGHPPGLVFANLIDFDMVYGHRNDPRGYARALEKADRGLGQVRALLPPRSLLAVCADHGCDPTHPGTDHTREYVPLLLTAPGAGGPGIPLGTRRSLADLGATVAELLGLERPPFGTSFADHLRPWFDRA